ncbi:GTP-binding Era-like protein [Metamycoplasma cloacale]|uniref:GTPase Era n=1 Tax=Metamycoplasma cloacale TaxID=92401 RepID=A0A2Z4LLE2_9BACT|nr:GTPase Era [Metamycoplasma cloacale]AWX42495.1 GTPase Era [Metamycoplasma cloacale]VEU79159.1 GTP-binding Era-like protein [Metamycoplasma cloacale]
MKKNCIVGLIGRPNVGKSTLLNQILEYDLSIVSNYAQTTRDDIRGIYNDNDCQIIFIDTPGIHKGENLLSEKLNQKSYSILKDVDLVLFITPANETIGRGDEWVINKLNENNIKNKIAVISKIDLVNDNEKLNEKASKLKELGFKTVFGIGLNFKQTYKDLINEIKSYAYEGENLYPDDQIGDVSMRFLAKEYIRKAAIENLYQEIPHSIAVEINDFKEQEEWQPYLIDATIYVKKDSQKGILIGKNGSMIKKISTQSRLQMEEIFQHKIYLTINVKVNNDWVDDLNKIKKMGY